MLGATGNEDDRPTRSSYLVQDMDQEDASGCNALHEPPQGSQSDPRAERQAGGLVPFDGLQCSRDALHCAERGAAAEPVDGV